MDHMDGLDGVRLLVLFCIMRRGRLLADLPNLSLLYVAGTSGFQNFVNAISILNFDVDFFKPGCTVLFLIMCL